MSEYQDVKNLTIELLDEYLKPQGWKRQKGEVDIGFYYRKPQSYGRDEIVWWAEKGLIVPGWGVGTQIDIVQNVLLGISATGAIRPPVDKNQKTFQTSPQNYFLGETMNRYRVECHDEKDVRRSVALMREFIETIGIPMIDRYKDLRVLDQEINGDTPWYDSSGHWFGLVDFEISRLVIAKLAGNPRYEELVDATFRYYEVESAKNGHPFVYDRTNLTAKIPATVEYLKQVEPLRFD